MKNQKTTVDFTSQIEKKAWSANSLQPDGTITTETGETLSGTISVWEQRILYKHNFMTGQLLCTVTDFEDLIDYNVEFKEDGIDQDMDSGTMTYRVYCTKKSNPNHWIDLHLSIGYLAPGKAYVEPYDFTNDPTFEYGDISEAVQTWAQDNLWK